MLKQAWRKPCAAKASREFDRLSDPETLIYIVRHHMSPFIVEAVENVAQDLRGRAMAAQGLGIDADATSERDFEWWRWAWFHSPTARPRIEYLDPEIAGPVVKMRILIAAKNDFVSRSVGVQHEMRKSPGVQSWFEALQRRNLSPLSSQEIADDQALRARKAEEAASAGNGRHAHHERHEGNRERRLPLPPSGIVHRHFAVLAFPVKKEVSLRTRVMFSSHSQEVACLHHTVPLFADGTKSRYTFQRQSC